MILCFLHLFIETGLGGGKTIFKQPYLEIRSRITFLVERGSTALGLVDRARGRLPCALVEEIPPRPNPEGDFSFGEAGGSIAMSPVTFAKSSLRMSQRSVSLD